MTDIRALFCDAADAAAPLVTGLAATGVITTLVEVARIRHGDPAVLRALARRERDAIGALRVI